MTTISDPRSSGLTTPPTVVYDEPPTRQPPALVVGPLAWIRNNLFHSWFDSLLTVLAGGLLVALVTSFFGWALTQANWFVINFNLRQFMVGRYETEYDWRAAAAALLLAFVLGFALAAWSRIPRIVTAAILVVIALTFVVPLVINAAIPLPSAYLTAGGTDIVSGASTQRPQDNLGFVARAGETVTIGLANDLVTSDDALRGLSSFADNGSNLLRAAAETRLANEARIAEINRLLAEDAANGPTLTAGQRDALNAELGRLEVPPPVTETYALNQAPVQIRILRGSTLEPILETTLDAATPPTSVTLPEDGWYVIEKTSEGTALLEAYGVYPLLERVFTRSEVRDESGAVVQQAGRYSEYVRMTDTFLTTETRPRIDGSDVPMTIIIDNQFRGDRTPAEYLRLYLAPFLSMISVGLLTLFVVSAIGYVAARLADRFSPPAHPRRVSRRTATWLLVASPVIGFAIIYGFGGLLPLNDTRRWGGLMLTLMLTIVGITASFPLGVLLALGRRSSLPVISTACTLYIEFVRGVPLITVLFMSQLLVPLINPSLAEVDNVFRAMIGITLFSAAYLAENVRGGLQSIPHGQEEAARAVGLGGWQITLLITLPQALRAVIPALVGQFISLFKDTSLVAIVGLIDLTGISEAVYAQTEFLGLRRESYIFITLIYFVFSYAMAWVSRRLEESGSGAARRV